VGVVLERLSIHAVRVTHYSRLSKVIIDVPLDTHDAEVAFWGDALGVEFTCSSDSLSITESISRVASACLVFCVIPDSKVDASNAAEWPS
jgi:hypothetical protein